MRLYAIWAIAGTLVVVWLLGVSGVFAAGAWIHLLLIIAMLGIAFSLFSPPPRTV